MTDSTAAGRPVRADYRHFVRLDTRWSDNDIYGHVNNVQYYSYFDTAVNRMLIEAGVLDIHHGTMVAYVVESACSYFRPISYPDPLEVGIRVARLGRSSVRYELAIFRAGDDSACAAGVFVHVYVDRRSNRAVPIPEATRRLLTGLLPESPLSDAD